MKSKIIPILLSKFPKKFSIDTLWLSLAQISLILSGLILNIIITKYFSVSLLGVYNQVLGIYSILGVVFSLGINNSIIYQLSLTNGEKKNAEIFSSNIFISIICSILLTVVCWLITIKLPFIFSSTQVANNMLLIYPAIILFIINKNFMSLLTAFRYQKQYSIIRTFRWLLIVMITLLFSLIYKNSNLIFAAPLITEAIIFIFMLILYNKYILFNFKLDNLKTNLMFAFKSYISEVFSIVSSKADLVILGYVLVANQVGEFSFLIYFAKSILIFPGILQQNLNPIVRDYYYQKRLIELIPKLKKVKIINLITISVQSIFICLFYYILVKYYLFEYFDTFNYLLLAVISVFPLAMISWGGGILVMTNHLKQNFYRTLIIMIVSGISLLLLSNVFGIYGAILSIFITSVISVILLNEFSKSRLSIRLL